MTYTPRRRRLKEEPQVPAPSVKKNWEELVELLNTVPTDNILFYIADGWICSKHIRQGPSSIKKIFFLGD